MTTKRTTPAKPRMKITKRHVATHAVAALVAAGAMYGAGPSVHQSANLGPSSSPSVVSSSPLCNASLWDNTYRPDRFIIENPCLEVTGTVESIRAEADGDYHVQVQMDKQFSNLTNAANQQYQNGNLVAEIICAAQPITQVDAIQPCMGYTNDIPVPSVGERVVVRGSYVLDTQHHSWAEIHPVSAMFGM